jgi:hypothetical protein
MTIISKLRSRRVVRVLRWIVHILVVILILVLLRFLNLHSEISKYLISPYPRLHGYWLPILFVLLYFTAWCIWWFYRLIANRVRGDFPDIDTAWTEALEKLDEAGIDIRTVPVFLVLGQPQAGNPIFFSSTKLPFTLREEPARPDSPIHLYATREVIFVTVESLSALNVFIQKRHHSRIEQSKQVQDTSDPTISMLEAPAMDLLGSMISPGATGEISSGNTLESKPSTMDPNLDEQFLETAVAAATPEISEEERQLLSARLEYLGHRIRLSRAPHCSINGLLLLVPHHEVRSEIDADRFASMCRSDLTAIENGTQVLSPTLLVLSDADTLPGFPELLKQTSPDRLQDRLLGRSFPMIPQLKFEERYDMVKDGLDWMVGSLLPGLIYSRYLNNLPSSVNRWSDANRQMELLIGELLNRQTAIARLVAQGLMANANRPPLVAGVYLAATGIDGTHQGFSTGLVARLLSIQDQVAWTEAAIQEDRDNRRITRLGYLSMTVVLIALIGFAIETWR